MLAPETGLEMGEGGRVPHKAILSWWCTDCASGLSYWIVPAAGCETASQERRFWDQELHPSPSFVRAVEQSVSALGLTTTGLCPQLSSIYGGGECFSKGDPVDTGS